MSERTKQIILMSTTVPCILIVMALRALVLPIKSGFYYMWQELYSERWPELKNMLTSYRVGFARVIANDEPYIEKQRNKRIKAAKRLNLIK